jgi:hypothetical protein
VLIGGLFGIADAHLPGPQSVRMFWVANLASPWLVLAFLAGWAQRSLIWAVAAAVAADLTSIAGFYLQVLTVNATRLGLPPSTPHRMLLAHGVHHWLLFIAPWCAVAVIAGIGYGTLGWWWRRSRSIIAGAFLGLPFVAEPWLWPLYTGYYQGPLTLWIIETAVGVVLLTWVIAVWRSNGHSRLTRKRVADRTRFVDTR